MTVVDLKEEVVPKMDVVILPKKIKKKTKLKKKETAVVTLPAKVNIPASEKIRPDSIVFYGYQIRTTFMNNQWFFSLEDILKIVGVVDPTRFLIDLKNLESLKDKYYQLVETFSYYEGNSPIIIPVVNFQNFMVMLPALREKDLSFPGPFPDWLREVANRKF